MATQNFKRNPLNLYREGKNIATLFPPATWEREKCLTLAGYFLRLETLGLPACYPLNQERLMNWYWYKRVTPKQLYHSQTLIPQIPLSKSGNNVVKLASCTYQVRGGAQTGFRKPGNVFTPSWPIFIYSVIHSLSHVQLFVTPWTASRQTPLSSTISQSLRKLKFIDSVMLSNYLILCHSHLL